jgi:hypothetical protein
VSVSVYVCMCARAPPRLTLSTWLLLERALQGYIGAFEIKGHAVDAKRPAHDGGRRVRRVRRVGGCRGEDPVHTMLKTCGTCSCPRGRAQKWRCSPATTKDGGGGGSRRRRRPSTPDVWPLFRSPTISEPHQPIATATTKDGKRRGVSCVAIRECIRTAVGSNRGWSGETGERSNRTSPRRECQAHVEGRECRGSQARDASGQNAQLGDRSQRRFPL